MAAKRWLSQHHQHFDDYSVTSCGDDLYANQPLCQLTVETYRQFSFLSAWLDFLDKNNGLETLTERRWNGKYGEIWQYRLASQVPLRNGQGFVSCTRVNSDHV